MKKYELLTKIYPNKYSIKQGIFFYKERRLWNGLRILDFFVPYFCFIVDLQFTFFFVSLLIELQFTFLLTHVQKPIILKSRLFLFVHTLQIGILVFANFLSVCVYSVKFVHPHLNFNLWQNYLRAGPLECLKIQGVGGCCNVVGVICPFLVWNRQTFGNRH